MVTFVLVVWLAGSGPARVDEFDSLADCWLAGEAWEAAGSGWETSARVGEDHREAARWVCLPGEK